MDSRSRGIDCELRDKKISRKEGGRKEQRAKASSGMLPEIEREHCSNKNSGFPVIQPGIPN
jgi:hypothetical protein